MNLLVIISDEHRKDAMGCMNHAMVKTPNLDHLAAKGTLFINAYTPSPMCVPARAALACGDYVHRSRYWDSATPFDGKQLSWMKSIRDRGVETVSIGKLHFRSCEDDNGFVEEILPMHVVDNVGWTLGLLRDNPPNFDNAAELAAEVGPGMSAYTEYDLAITRAAEKWLNARNCDSPPWAALVSFVSPHYPLKAPREYYEMYDPDAVSLPVAYRPDQRPKHIELNHIARFFDYDQYFDETTMRQAIACYFGLCTFLDDCVGRVMKALQQSGQLQNTLVLYVSDHGEMLGDHGLWTKQVMYEASAGVPMILSGPGIPAGKKIKTTASLLDIYPTALDAFEFKPSNQVEKHLPGQSLIKLANNDDQTNRIILSEYHDGGSTTGTFMIRWDKWKYVYYAGYRPQLFDLHNDPNELNDLSASAAHRTILVEAEKRLRKICDPEMVNRQCFEDQARRIEQLGGIKACSSGYNFNHTPVPDS